MKKLMRKSQPVFCQVCGKKHTSGVIVTCRFCGKRMSGQCGCYGTMNVSRKCCGREE